MTSIRLKIEESWYASMDCKVQKSAPWVCFYGGHSTGYKLGNHPKSTTVPCSAMSKGTRITPTVWSRRDGSLSLIFYTVHGNWVWYRLRFTPVIQSIHKYLPEHSRMIDPFGGLPLFSNAPQKRFFPSSWRLRRLRDDNQWRYGVLIIS